MATKRKPKIIHAGISVPRCGTTRHNAKIAGVDKDGNKEIVTCHWCRLMIDSKNRGFK